MERNACIANNVFGVRQVLMDLALWALYRKQSLPTARDRKACAMPRCTGQTCLLSSVMRASSVIQNVPHLSPLYGRLSHVSNHIRLSLQFTWCLLKVGVYQLHLDVDLQNEQCG